jgi:hypothetical protein
LFDCAFDIFFCEISMFFVFFFYFDLFRIKPLLLVNFPGHILFLAWFIVEPTLWVDSDGSILGQFIRLCLDDFSFLLSFLVEGVVWQTHP